MTEWKRSRVSLQTTLIWSSSAELWNKNLRAFGTGAWDVYYKSIIHKLLTSQSSKLKTKRFLARIFGISITKYNWSRRASCSTTETAKGYSFASLLRFLFRRRSIKLRIDVSLKLTCDFQLFFFISSRAAGDGLFETWNGSNRQERNGE